MFYKFSITIPEVILNAQLHKDYGETSFLLFSQRILRGVFPFPNCTHSEEQPPLHLLVHLSHCYFLLISKRKVTSGPKM